MKMVVSVIVPCYNQASFLSEALQSIYNQTYFNWECLIINDGSDDNTDEVANSWVLKDVRFKYFEKENGGLSSARNFGIQKAKGIYILPLDADDFFEKTFIEKALNSFSSNANLKIVYAEARYFGLKSNKWTREEFDYNKMLISNMIYSAAMFKREEFERVGGYDENILYEDWDFWLRLLKDGGEVYRVPEILFNYRIHGKGSLMNDLSKKGKNHDDSLKIIFSKNIDKFIELYGNPIEIERKRQKLMRELNHPLHKMITKHKKSLIGRLVLKFIK